MKIRELKSELASHGICAVGMLEKSELVRAVHEARKAAAAKRQKKRGNRQEVKQGQPPHHTHANAHSNGKEDYPEERRSEEKDKIASMSVKQLKVELEKCGISPSQFFEKGDMQEALRSAQSIDRNEHTTHQHSSYVPVSSTKPAQTSKTAPPSVFPASLSESFGTKPQPSARTASGSSASTPTNSPPKKPRPPERSTKVSDRYSWCSSKESSSDVTSSTSSRRSARRHSREERSQPASYCDASAGSHDGDMKRMPQSFFPVNTFDSGTAGGEPMGGSPGAGLGSSVGADDTVFSDSPTDGYTDATDNTVTETTFVPASFKKASVHHHSQKMSRGGKRNDVKRQKHARAPAQQSPSSVAYNSFEQDARPEWLQM